jgi:osmoprotectant transport system substrate-binding protein
MDRRAFLATLPLLLEACSPAHRITVGSKNFTEQLILGEMLAQLIESETREPIDRRLYLAGTYICHQALLAGRIDLYAEYTGTALAAVLKQRPTGDHRQVYETVKDEYLRRFGLEVFPSLGFDNSFAIVMRGDDAARYRITKLSQLAPFSPKLRMGVGYEFLERRDGFDGLVNTYGLRFAATPRVMDLGLLYRALENRQVDLIAGANTDGLIAALRLASLADDRHYFPPYDAVPIVRHDTLQRHPAVRRALDRITGCISVDEMRSMNYAVDGEKRDPAQVAREFLVSHRLIASNV